MRQKFRRIALGAVLAPALMVGGGCSTAADSYDGIVKNQRIIDVDGPGRLVSCRYILQTGRAPINDPFSLVGIFNRDYRISWDRDDLFTQAITELHKVCMEAADADPLLKALKEKGVWNYDDRALWEEGLGRIVSAELEKIKGLALYRTPSMHDCVSNKYFNDLWVDIRDNTTTLEFDCLHHAVIEGVLIQDVEDRSLKKFKGSEGFKKPHPYFIAGNIVFLQGEADTDMARHACVLSSATANILEGTVSGSTKDRLVGTYMESYEPYNFSMFVAGEPFVGFYSAYIYSIDGQKVHFDPINNQVSLNPKDLTIFLYAPDVDHEDAVRDMKTLPANAAEQMIQRWKNRQTRAKELVKVASLVVPEPDGVRPVP